MPTLYKTCSTCQGEGEVEKCGICGLPITECSSGETFSYMGTCPTCDGTGKELKHIDTLEDY